MLRGHAQLIQQGQLQVGERRVLRINQVTAALQRPTATTHQKRR